MCLFYVHYFQLPALVAKQNKYIPDLPPWPMGTPLPANFLAFGYDPATDGEYSIVPEQAGGAGGQPVIALPIATFQARRQAGTLDAYAGWLLLLTGRADGLQIRVYCTGAREVNGADAYTYSPDLGTYAPITYDPGADTWSPRLAYDDTAVRTELADHENRLDTAEATQQQHTQQIGDLLPAPVQPDGVRLVTDRIRTESEIVFGTEAVADSRITITPSSIVASAASSQSYFGSANIVLKEDNISFFAQPGQLTFFTGNGTTIPRARIAYGEGGELLLTANHVRVPTPTAEQDAATKLYVDSLVGNGTITGIRPGTGTNSIIVGDIGETNEASGQDSICVGGYNNIAAGTRSAVHDGHDTEVYGSDCAAYSSVGCVVPATAERVRLLGCTAFTVPAGTVDKVYVNNQQVGAASTLRDVQDVPETLRDAVAAGSYSSGELQGTQPAGSLAGFTFTTATYGYAYQRGAAGALVWNRFVKA